VAPYLPRTALSMKKKELRKITKPNYQSLNIRLLVDYSLLSSASISTFILGSLMPFFSPIPVFLMNSNIAFSAFSCANSFEIGFHLAPHQPTSLPTIFQRSLISIFHLEHSLKRWSLISFFPDSHHQQVSVSNFLTFFLRYGAVMAYPNSS
jgi:hypothetical protein